MKNAPVQVRLSGSGGQGLITAGVILAEAAMLDGQNVVQTQSYGPEARLGSSKAEVILSRGVIAYPEVIVPDVLLCLSADAAGKYTPKVHADTIVILDSSFVADDRKCGGKVLRVAITPAAVEVGSRVVANTVALGVLNTAASLVSPESLAKAVADRVPAKFRDLNLRALEAGIRLMHPAGAAEAGRAPAQAAAGSGSR